MLSRRLKVEVFGPDPGYLLNRLIKAGIPVENVVYVDDLTIILTIHRKDLKTLKKNCVAADNVRVVAENGLLWRLNIIFKHPLVTAALLIILVLSSWLPTRILHVEVVGNRNIESAFVLEQASLCGIRFGTARKTVRSEKVKNQLLERIPQLEWAAVTTSGCKATVFVKEKEQKKTEALDSRVSSLVAVRDGLVRNITVTQGTALCSVGDTVKAGQMLVSGYTDCGIYIKAGSAQAEIQGQTLRKLDAYATHSTTIRGAETSKSDCIYLRIGKKLIKLYEGSGIPDTTCAKMRMVYDVQLPGGFPLPLQFVHDSYIGYETVSNSDSYNCDWLALVASDYLYSQMVAGVILNQRTEHSCEEDVCRLQASYSCIEELGIIMNEEIVRTNEQSD